MILISINVPETAAKHYADGPRGQRFSSAEDRLKTPPRLKSSFASLGAGLRTGVIAPGGAGRRSFRETTSFAVMGSPDHDVQHRTEETSSNFYREHRPLPTIR